MLSHENSAVAEFQAILYLVWVCFKIAIEDQFFSHILTKLKTLTAELFIETQENKHTRI